MIPVGTPVIGRFESNEQGSFFLTQAIILENRKIPIQARSPLLDSLFSINPLPRRDHSVNLPPSVSTSSRVVIEPNAVLPVQLSEDLQY